MNEIDWIEIAITLLIYLGATLLGLGAWLLIIGRRDAERRRYQRLELRACVPKQRSGSRAGVASPHERIVIRLCEGGKMDGMFSCKGGCGLLMSSPGKCRTCCEREHPGTKDSQPACVHVWKVVDTAHSQCRKCGQVEGT